MFVCCRKNCTTNRAFFRQMLQRKSFLKKYISRTNWRGQLAYGLHSEIKYGGSVNILIHAIDNNSAPGCAAHSWTEKNNPNTARGTECV